MRFHKWISSLNRLDEATLADLYQSAVDAFPGTTKRQHATEPVRIVDLTWTPFLGVRTLFVKGRSQNEGREYGPMILFKGVQYHDAARPGLVEITASDGRDYVFEKLRPGGTEVLVRCGCPDFVWRFNYYDHLDRSLYGSKRRKYESAGGPAANPLGLPGMCKHLMKLAQALDHAGIMED